MHCHLVICRGDSQGTENSKSLEAATQETRIQLYVVAVINCQRCERSESMKIPTRMLSHEFVALKIPTRRQSPLGKYLHFRAILNEQKKNAHLFRYSYWRSWVSWAQCFWIQLNLLSFCSEWGIIEFCSFFLKTKIFFFLFYIFFYFGTLRFFLFILE